MKNKLAFNPPGTACRTQYNQLIYFCDSFSIGLNHLGGNIKKGKYQYV
jgi:hypothetical protein